MTFAVTEFVADNFESIVDKNADGSVWECTFDVRNSQADNVQLLYKYTKNTSTNFTLKTEFTNINVDGEVFGETIIDNTLLTVVDAELTIGIAGSYRLIIPVSKASDKVKLTITPDVSTGTDTLEIYMDELTVKSKR